MPSAALQSRINMFEQPSSSPLPVTPSHPSSPPTLLLESPLSPTMASIPPMAPSTKSSPEFVPGNSLIDLKDWVIDDNHYSGHTHTPSVSPTAPLIHLQSPPRPKQPAPPLPPRKPSYTSLKSVSSTSSISPSIKGPSRRNDSLTVDYSHSPGASNKRFNQSPGHMPASSVSSFHSISLSSDGEPMTPAPDPCRKLEPSDTGASSKASTSESFEEVSASSIVNPSTTALMAEQGRSSTPPKLPQRTPNTSPPTSPALRYFQNSSSSITTIRRPPPPRPISSRSTLTTSSGHSSVLSDATSITSGSSNSLRTNPTKFSSQKAVFPVKRPTPVPSAARARFELLFKENLKQVQKVEQQRLTSSLGAEKKKSGWRGLSVDLVTSPELTRGSVDQGFDSNERLEGYVVKEIWSRSKLVNPVLRAIWAECDTQHRGSLSQEEFVRGMWRIDEELGRARLKNYRFKGSIRQPFHINTGSNR